MPALVEVADSPFIVEALSAPARNLPALAKQLAGDPDQLHAGKANFILKPLMGEHSLLLLDGPDQSQARAGR